MNQIVTPRTDSPPVGFELLAELERTGALTKTSLTLTDPDLSYERWEALGGLFGAVKRTTSFLIGDWINFGESVYGEKYAQAADLTGLTSETLTVYASVCRRVSRSRRREELSFGHHDAIAALEPKEQKRWLGEAVKNRWSRRELRDALRASGEAPPLPEQPDWTPGLLDPPAPVGVGSTGPGSPLAVLTGERNTANGAVAPGATLTLVGTSTTAFADLCRRLVEEAIPQGHFVRVPRSTFDELAAFFAEE